MNKLIMTVLIILLVLVGYTNHRITKLTNTVTGLTYLVYATSNEARSFLQIFTKYDSIKDPEARRFLQARNVKELFNLPDTGAINGNTAKTN